MAARHRLVVLYGGQSAEHDVSCVTARHVIAAVSTDRYDVEAIAINRDGQWNQTDLAALRAGGSGQLPASLPTHGVEVSPGATLSSNHMPTVVLPLLHGPMGEDGTIQGLLDLASVPYVGTGVLGSALCMDKAMAKQAAEALGIAQGRWISVHADELGSIESTKILRDLGPTVFVKPANMGSSVGVTRCTNKDELGDALRVAATYDEWIVIEEAIAGREIEVAVLGTRSFEASVPGEIVPGDSFYTYEDKYLDGVANEIIPAPLSPERTEEVRALACRAAAAFRVDGLARVDFFLEDPGRGFLLNEINTMPGFTPISMFPKLWHATGLDYSDLIDRMIDLAVERHERRLAHRSTQRA